MLDLTDDSGSASRLVLPAGWELLASAVVSSESVDSALDKDEVKLGVLILSVLLKMLAHGNSLLDEMVEVLWNFRSHTLGLEDSENLRTGDALELWDAHRVSEGDADLGWSETLLSELHNMFDNILGLELEPRWRSALVRESRAGNTFTLSVNTSHVITMS
jgi:hypothetical protein